jgi:hypothetical protein
MVQTTYLQRGHRNNGIIEIENEPDQEDPRFYEETIKGVVYRLPERGIKLDFVEKVKQKNGLSSRGSSVRMRTTESSRAQSVADEPVFTSTELEAAVALGNMGLADAVPSRRVSEATPVSDPRVSYMSMLIENAQNETTMTNADEDSELQRLLAARREMDRRIEELTKAASAKKTPEPVTNNNTEEEKDGSKNVSELPDLAEKKPDGPNELDEKVGQTEDTDTKLRDTITVDLAIPDTNSDDFEEAFDDL